MSKTLSVIQEFSIKEKRISNYHRTEVILFGSDNEEYAPLIPPRILGIYFTRADELGSRS
jgi:hypothetical protein